jgi:hypothetical protein
VVMEEGERHRGKRRSRYGSPPEEHSKRRSKRGSTRYSNSEAIGAGGQRSKWIGEEDCGGGRWWADRINPTTPPSQTLYTSSNPSGRRPCRPLGPPAGPNGLCHTPLWAEPILVPGLVSFKETNPLLLLSFLFSVYLVCSFKFCLNSNLNLV